MVRLVSVFQLELSPKIHHLTSWRLVYSSKFVVHIIQTNCQQPPSQNASFVTWLVTLKTDCTFVRSSVPLLEHSLLTMCTSLVCISVHVVTLPSHLVQNVTYTVLPKCYICLLTYSSNRSEWCRNWFHLKTIFTVAAVLDLRWSSWTQVLHCKSLTKSSR